MCPFVLRHSAYAGILTTDRTSRLARNQKQTIQNTDTMGSRRRKGVSLSVPTKLSLSFKLQSRSGMMLFQAKPTCYQADPEQGFVIVTIG